MILKELGLFYGYYSLNNIFENYFNKKNARNMIAAFHASSSVVINTLYLITGNEVLNIISQNFSTGYFLYDSYYIVRFDKMNFLRYCYLYHHFATLYLIKHNFVFNGIHLILLTGELSNLPSYVIYYNLHVDKKSRKTEERVSLFKKIQKISYTFIRIPVMSYLLYDMANSLDLSTYSSLSILGVAFPVYLMGLIWSYKLVSE